MILYEDRKYSILYNKEMDEFTVWEREHSKETPSPLLLTYEYVYPRRYFGYWFLEWSGEREPDWHPHPQTVSIQMVIDDLDHIELRHIPHETENRYLCYDIIPLISLPHYFHKKIILLWKMRRLFT
jgi:hypothetical protein